MNKKDINLLIKQIQNIILNKPLSEKLKSKSKDLIDLQESIFYLSNCLSESNEFLKHLQIGNLDAQPPSRHNFLAGNLKELHSSLKHLTWQATQVANGDYSQSVSFLGDFSTSFNQMIHQLAERESKLKHQTVALKETVDLIKSIINGLKDWIVVTDNEDGEIIYINQSAKQLFYDIETKEYICKQPCALMNRLKQYQNDKEHLTFDYTCPLSMKTLRAKSFIVQWNNKLAYVHYIQDVTNEKKYQEQMEEMAYTDELTGLYNRRYCIDQLNMLLSKKVEFAFCLIDLDDLKYANDNFGHVAGDKYIKTVANEMMQITDSTDVVCRLGGDEFAILFNNYKLEIILDKMNKLTKKIENLHSEFPMSISYGIIHIEQESNILSETVMAQADEKMYILKNIKKAAKRNLGIPEKTSLTWTKELKTGNVQIDVEHKELIKAINNLLTACTAKKGKRELISTINFLNQYTKTHFSHEQTLQIQSGYPDYKNHKKHHKWFISILNDISTQLKAEGSSPEIISKINTPLVSWLINHIKTEDIKVANHILCKKNNNIDNA